MTTHITVTPSATVTLEIGTVHKAHVGSIAFQDNFNYFATCSVSQIMLYELHDKSPSVERP